MNSIFALDGKRALITGASGGLGRHFAQVLGEAGAEVMLAARRLDVAEGAASVLVAAGGRATARALDVCDQQSVDAIFSAEPFDIVINNAGVAYDGPALDMSASDWNRVIDTDLTGVFRVAQSAARQMKGQGRGGVIVNISSILGLRVAGNVTAYAVAKAGVVQMTRALALEWARHGIRINSLCPGYIETDLNRDFFSSEAGQTLIKRVPQRRLGQMRELDGALLLLASDAGSFITGADLVVDGGHLVSSL